MNKSWLDYYLPLVNNSEKETLFYNKYLCFLNLIHKIINDCNINNIIEMGCGTGIITKKLLDMASFYIDRKNIILSDINEQMLQLARINNSKYSDKIKFIKYDINDSKYILHYNHDYQRDLIITHGVLEHFSEGQIVNIMYNFLHNNEIDTHVHYVPTDGYLTKSFVDENLWSVNKWIDLIKPDAYIVNGADLFMVKTKNKNFSL